MSEPATIRSEWLTVGAYIFAMGGFVWTVNYQLGQIGEKLKELNTTVAEEQRVVSRLVEHMNSVDKERAEDHERIRVLEARGR